MIRALLNAMYWHARTEISLTKYRTLGRHFNALSDAHDETRETLRNAERVLRLYRLYLDVNLSQRFSPHECIALEWRWDVRTYSHTSIDKLVKMATEYAEFHIRKHHREVTR